MIVRNLSRSKLKWLLSPSPLSTYYHTHTKPLSNSLFTVTPPSSVNPPKTTLFFFANHFSSKTLDPKSLLKFPLTRDGNYDEASEEKSPVCPGCGITMQDADSKQPGFFIQPSVKSPNYKGKWVLIEDLSEMSEFLKKGIVNEGLEFDRGGSFENVDKVFDEMSESEKNGERGGSFENVDNVFDKMSESEKNGESGKEGEKPVVCARCHSLRYYSKLKDPSVENLLPDFDFDHTIGRKLMSASGARSVVLLVVDATDFDGSFPKRVASMVSRTIEENAQLWKEGKPGNVPRLVLVVTKIDLLPTDISPFGLESWVRTRASEGGASKLTSLHLVSGVKDWGVKTLVDDVVKFAGERGNVWVIGAQNAGKSTLINAIGKCVGTKVPHLTEAPVAGTTLGIIRLEGALPGKAKLFDTPGLLQPHQISTRLTAEENKLIHIRKELKPRTYRIMAGNSVHIGGLLRLDIEELSVTSIYVTVWASSVLPLHMGKTEKASMMMEKHFGRQLQPPIGVERVEELGKWVRKEFHVSGENWNSSSVDIAAAGLGWFAIGLKGEARLGVWTYDGVDVIARQALLPHRALWFEVAGFTVSKIVSQADRAQGGAKGGQSNADSTPTKRLPLRST